MKTKHLYLIWISTVVFVGVASNAPTLLTIAAAAIVPMIDWTLKKI